MDMEPKVDQTILRTQEQKERYKLGIDNMESILEHEGKNSTMNWTLEKFGYAYHRWWKLLVVCPIGILA